MPRAADGKDQVQNHALHLPPTHAAASCKRSLNESKEAAWRALLFRNTLVLTSTRIHRCALLPSTPLGVGPKDPNRKHSARGHAVPQRPYVSPPLPLTQIQPLLPQIAPQLPRCHVHPTSISTGFPARCSTEPHSRPAMATLVFIHSREELPHASTDQAWPASRFPVAPPSLRAQQHGRSSAARRQPRALLQPSAVP